MKFLREGLCATSNIRLDFSDDSDQDADTGTAEFLKTNFSIAR